MVHSPPGARQRFAVRLLSTHRRQQHPERRRVDPFRDHRRRILSQRLAARAGTLQLGAVRRVVTQPGAAAEQPERRFHLCDKLQPEGLCHQPGRKTDQEGIRLRDPCDPELESGGSYLRRNLRFVHDGSEHLQGAAQRPPVGNQRERGRLHLLHRLRCPQLLPGDGRRQAAGLRERDHQRDLFRRRNPRAGYDPVQMPQVRQLSECPFEGLRHADHRHGQRAGHLGTGRNGAGSREPGVHPPVADKGSGRRERRPAEEDFRIERGRCRRLPAAVQREPDPAAGTEKGTGRMAAEAGRLRGGKGGSRRRQ